MKILITAGTWNLEDGRKSGLVEKMYSFLKNREDLEIDYFNGGNYENLKDILNSAALYEVIFWMANVPNELPKIRDVKEVAPFSMLVSSKRNDNDKYSFKELVERSIAMKSNLTFEFKKKDSGLFNIMVFDVLGAIWYDGENIEDALDATIKRLTFLMSITRKKTSKTEDNKNLKLNWYFDRFKSDEEKTDEKPINPINDEYLDLIINYSKDFYKILGPNDNEKIMKEMGKVPPQVFRCAKGMPSFRSGKYTFVSRRNVEGKFLTKEDFLATFMEDDKLYYTGDYKPSVDTPVHIKLYDKLSNINYILHSHNYIEGAPFTNIAIPCGAVEEADEVIETILKNYGSLDLDKYVINLKGHGSFLLAKNIDLMKDIKYVGRPMPERM